MTSSPLTFAEKAIQFFSSLKLDLPQELRITVLNPYTDAAVKACVQKFFQKFFNDQRPRIFMMGINPGRLGGGLTGISFTDPVALRNFCGIENDFGEKRELSSEFIYKVIEVYGGVDAFYGDIFISAICPLGFMKGSVNYNYYDDKKLQNAVTSFIEKTFQQQLEMGARRDVLVCIGTGKNKAFMEALNAQSGYFKRIVALEHPRFIMQYRRKKLAQYIDLYVKTLQSI
jgi:hypothetical protein